MPTDMLALAEQARVDLARAEEEFRRPRFRRAAVAVALGVATAYFEHWYKRGQIALDADEDRGTGWRLYSPLDAVRLGIAIHLTRSGLSSSNLKATLLALEDVFPLRVANPYLASNSRAVLAVTLSGGIIGPIIGPLDLDEAPDEAVIILRIGEVVREALEPLGYSLTRGPAAEMLATAKRLRAAGER